ncbi:MAG: CoF synthetase, partial [Myxococcota bacterium]
IGYQCAECPRGVFHAHDDQTYIEIVDEEGKPCEPGEVGDILVTPFARRLAPTVRFRVGDRARWLDDPCSCGRTTPRFELLGRGDDTLRIGYDSVDYGFVQELVADLQKRYGTSALSGAVQIQKHRREGRDLLRVCIESNASGDSRTEIIEALHARLLAQRPSLRQFVEKETIWSPEIELSAPGSLERNPRTGKLRRVIDSIPED